LALKERRIKIIMMSMQRRLRNERFNQNSNQDKKMVDYRNEYYDYISQYSDCNEYDDYNCEYYDNGRYDED
jgi:hypothetical protein